MNNFIEISKLRKYYRSQKYKEPIKALDGIDLNIGKGEILGLIGESGCGKSTLGRLLVGLENMTSGKILFENQEHSSLIKKDRKKFYKNVQMIFQNPYDVFDKRYKIGKILDEVLKNHNIGNSKFDRSSIISNKMEYASLIPVTDFLSRYPNELSGGQLQRIAILRSMLLNPKFLVADEPITMLDVSVRSEIIKLLIKMREENDTSILFISHDIATTGFISDKIAIMYLGQIVEEGKTDKVLKEPLHPYTVALLSNVYNKNSKRNKPTMLKGDPPSPIGLKNRCYFANRCFKAKDKCFNENPQIENISDDRKIRCFYYK